MEDRILLVLGKSTLAVEKGCLDILSLRKSAANLQGLQEDSVYFTYNGRIVESLFGDFHFKENLSTIRCNVRLPGGKGGFGSMLRALGAQIEKTTNREACRDLSGRRMRDVNNEKKIADWLEKEKKDEEERTKKKRDKLERILNPPKHMLKDPTYINEIKDNADRVTDALRQGLENAASDKTASTRKREHKKNETGKAKRQKMWLDINEDEEDFTSDSDLEAEGEAVSPVMDCIVSPVDDAGPSVVGSNEENENEITKAHEAAVSVEKEVAGNETSNKAALREAVSTVPENCTQESIEQVEEKVDSIDLSLFSTAEELEAFGLERLKSELSKHGLKCGGTLQQRAQRLFLLKNTPVDQLDASLFAKPNKKNKKAQS